MGSTLLFLRLQRYILNMIKRLLVILLLNRVAHSMGIRNEAKSSDVDSYSLYDSIKVSNSEASLINEWKRRKVRSPQNSAALGNEVSIEELPSVGVNGGRRYINRLLKTLAPQAADNLNPDIKEKTTDESLADFLLESVVNIGLVQAKVNTALKNYRADVQKNMLKELKKIATEVYKELDSSSSDSSDSDDEDSDDEDVFQLEDIVQDIRSPLFQQDGEDEESSRFSRFKQDDREDEEDDSDDEDSDGEDSDEEDEEEEEEEEEEDEDEEEEDDEEEDNRSAVVTERRGKFFYTDYDEQIY